MKRKAVSGMILSLLLVGMLSLVLYFQLIDVEQVASASDETFVEATSISSSHTSDNWWNSSWKYRTNHTIGSASGAGTNYQVRFHLHWDSGVNLGEDLYFHEAAQSDFDDVRFLDDDHTTLLDYWIQDEAETANDTHCWVEILDDLTASDVTIWIYYGNPAASSLSNGANTFIDFDDYEYTDSLENHGWNITNIAPGGSLAPQTAVASHGSYALKSYDPDYLSAGNGWKRYPTCPARVLWHWKVRKEEITGLYSCVWLDAKEDGNQFGQIQWQHLTYNVRARTASGSWVNFATYTPGQWHEVEVVVNTDTDKYQSIWWDGNLKATNVSAYQASGNVTHLHHNHAGSIGFGTAYEDFFYARKYVDPEPQHGSWGTPEGYDRATTILSPQNRHYASTSLPLTFTVNETASWMGYSLDGQANVTVAGNTTLMSLLDGLHNVVVYANGTAGIMWASVPVYFVVDITPPTVSVLSPENTTYTVAIVPLTFTVNEPTSRMGYSLDDEANVTISSNTTLIIMTNGSHSLTVYANDVTGNTGVSTVFFTMEQLACSVDIANAVTVFPGYTLFETTEVFNEWNLPINVTVQNTGTMPLTGSVNGYYTLDNSTWLSMGPSQPVTLNPINETMLVFYWNLKTTGADKSVCYMKFNATVTSEDLTATDEFLVKIKVRLMGDSDGDNDCDVGDQRKIQVAMFTGPYDPTYLYWNSFPVFTDMDGDGDVDVGDQRKQQLWMFKTWYDP